MTSVDDGSAHCDDPWREAGERQRVAEDMATCWFCGGTASPGRELALAMHRDEGQRSTAIFSRSTFLAVDVLIPRCARCRAGHGIERALLIGGLVLLLVRLGPVVAAFGPISTATFGMVWAVPFLAWLGIRSGGLRSRWLAPEPGRYGRRHPKVELMRHEGWMVGARPF